MHEVRCAFCDTVLDRDPPCPQCGSMTTIVVDPRTEALTDGFMQGYTFMWKLTLAVILVLAAILLCH